MSQNKVIIVAGPTASGKSAMAIDIARALDGVVINADSMQVYKGMPIITAAPTEEDKQKAPHRLYEIYEPTFRGNVAMWLKLASEEIKKVWAEGKVPVVVGGTGLYIENLMEGVTPVAEIDEKIRKKVEALVQKEGLAAVHQKLSEVDPASGKKININDSSRIKRAYEVYLSTGKPFSEWQKQPRVHYLPEARFFVIKICPPTDELDKLAYERFDKMVQCGALEEVECLYKQKIDDQLPAMKALGVPELIEHFKGKTAIYEAIQNAKLHTRQYAKRQRTWFKNKLKADYTFLKCYKGDFPKEILALLKKVIESEN